MRHTTVLWSLVFAMLATTHPAKAIDDPAGAATLAGLAGVFVDVEDFKPLQEQAGFQRQTFLTDVELKLRLAGIKVLTRDQSIKIGGSLLILSVTALHSTPGEQAAFCVHLALIQGVILQRDPTQYFAAPTWTTEKVGYGNLKFAREAVKDEVDAFINAWLSVHPKK